MMKNNPDKVILHCAATPDFEPNDPHFDRFGIEQITEWHLQRGFTTVGYHYVIRRTGVLEVGRPEDVVGAHCLGENHRSIGICYVGTRAPTAEQLTTLDHLFKVMVGKYGFKSEQWRPHHQFAPWKECPGLDMVSLRKRFDMLLSDQP